MDESRLKVELIEVGQGFKSCERGRMNEPRCNLQQPTQGKKQVVLLVAQILAPCNGTARPNRVQPVYCIDRCGFNCVSTFTDTFTSAHLTLEYHIEHVSAGRRASPLE